jgi:tRNA pseudouridine13 synthase
MPLDLLAPPPLLTASLPGIGGRIKQTPEDFEVEEIPAYEASGNGAFLYLWIEKRDMGAEYFERFIARRLGIPVGEVGTAGLKDRHAITRQYVSVPESVADRLAQLDGEGVRVLGVSRHGNKLRPGHLRGNRFRIRIREVIADAASHLEPIIARLRSEGLPNFYGPQRFGRDGETARLGLAMLRGESDSRNRFLRKLALSAAQSALFNRYLAQRMADGLLHRVQAGDVMAKQPTGGLFVAEDLPVEQARFDARETIHTGPIFGRKMFKASATAAEREAAVLAEAGLGRDAFAGFGKLLQGTRRLNLVYVNDLSFEIDTNSVVLAFTLPAGSYATIFLREITKTPDLPIDEGR